TDGQRAEDLALHAQRQREQRAEAAPARDLAPERRQRVGQHVVDDAGGAAADGRAGGTAALLAVGPGELRKLAEVALEADLRQPRDRLGLVVLGAADECRPVARLLDHDAADLLQQRRLVFGAQQRSVAAAQRAQRAAQ